MAAKAPKKTPLPEASPEQQPAEALPPWEQVRLDYEARAWAERAKNRGKNPKTGAAPDVRKGGR